MIIKTQLNHGRGWEAVVVDNTGDAFAIGPCMVNGDATTIQMEHRGMPDTDGHPKELKAWLEDEANDKDFQDTIDLTEAMGAPGGEAARWAAAYGRAAANLTALAKYCEGRAAEFKAKAKR